MSTISPSKKIENKHDVYRGKYCMKMFCESLREHARKIINFNKMEKPKLLTKEHRESFENAKIFYICKKILKIHILKVKNSVQLGIIVIIQGI